MAQKYAVIGGVRIELAELKKGLKRDFGMSQRDFAEHSGVDQGHVSRILNGKRDINRRFASAVVDLLSTHGKTLQHYAPAAGGQGAQTFDEVIDSLTDEDQDASEDEHEGRDDFPLSKAQKVAVMARAAGKDALDFEGTFSLRKLIKWGRAFHVLLKAGLGWKDALGGAYWLAAVYAAEDEGRRFLLESFQRVFAFDAKRPVDAIPHKPDQHPAEPLMELFVQAGEHVWAFGPTGCGKTFAAKRVAERHSQTGMFFRFQGDRDKSVDDFVGSYGADGGSTFVYTGVLPHAMDNGQPLIIDEPTICDGSVLMALQAVLEGDKLSITKGEGRTVEPNDGFVVIACDNTRGLGEAVEYVGTEPINEAMRDRFIFIEFDYMTEKQERGIVEDEIGSWLNGSRPMVEDSNDDDAADDATEGEEPEWYDRLAS